MLLVPLVLGWVVTEAIEGGQVSAAWWGVAAILGLAVTEALFDGWRHRLENGASADGAGRLRRSVLRGALGGRASPALDPGDVVARGTDDADTVAALVDSLGYTVAYALSVPVAVVLLAAIDPVLALLCVAALACGVPIARVAARPLEARAAILQEATAATVAEVQAVLLARRAAQGLGAVPMLTARFRDRSARVCAAAAGVARVALRTGPIGALVSGAPVVAVLAWGGLGVADGTLSLGALTAAVGLALYVVGPVGAVVDQALELGVARSSAVRISAVAAAPGHGSAAVSRVTLHHDPTFWTATVRDNLALGQDLDDRALQHALAAVELDHAGWPDGLETDLADAGGHLSGGQRQRLALARALLHAGPADLDVADGLDGVGPAQRARLLALLGTADRG